MDTNNLIMDIRPIRSFVPTVQPRQAVRPVLEFEHPRAKPPTHKSSLSPTMQPRQVERPVQEFEHPRERPPAVRKSMDFYFVPKSPAIVATNAAIPVFKPHEFPEPVNEIPYKQDELPTPDTLIAAKGKLSLVKSVGQYLLLVAAGIFLGFASSDIQVGQIAIGVYGLAAVIFKIKSQYTFAGALITLILVPILLALDKQVLANNFAVYAYLLLVVGVISAAIELRRDRKVEASA